MRIDCIIPVYKPDKGFIRLLNMLVAQSIKPERIILMYTMEEGNSEKELYDMLNNKIQCEQGSHIRIDITGVKKSDFDHAATRNKAAAMCKGDYLLFMTQDAVPYDNNLIQKLIDPFIKIENTAVSYARQLPGIRAGEKERYTRLYNYPDVDMCKTVCDEKRLGIKTYFSSDVCALYDRGVFNTLSGFIDSAIFNEDMLYAYKAARNGYCIYYASEAQVIHYHNYSWLKQFRRNFDLAVSQADNKAVFDSISSEKEGIRYVKNALKHFVNKRCYLTAVDFCVECVFKYAGYLFGKNYDKLPHDVVLRITENKEYFYKKWYSITGRDV